MDGLREHLFSFVIVAELIVMDDIQTVIKIIYHFADDLHIQ